MREAGVGGGGRGLVEAIACEGKAPEGPHGVYRPLREPMGAGGQGPREPTRRREAAAEAPERGGSRPGLARGRGAGAPECHFNLMIWPCCV